MLATEAPFPQYFDIDGDPLDGGKLYFGLPNQDPETHPIPVFWDAEGTQPAAQPIRTMNGYTARAGTPANVFVDGYYSINVRNKKGELVYYAPDSAEFSTAAQLSDTTDPTKGDALVGVKQPFAGAVGRTQHDKNTELISAKDFGAVGDFNEVTGTGADDTAALQAWIDAIASRGPGKGVGFLPRGWYKKTGVLNIPYGVSIRGEGGTASVIYSVGCDGLNFTTYGYAIGLMVFENFGLTAQSGSNFSAVTTLKNAASTMDGLYFSRMRFYGWNECFIWQANWSCTIFQCVAENINRFVSLSSGDGQAVAIRIISNRVVRSAGGLGAAPRNAIECHQSTGFTESVHILHNYIYGFDKCVVLSKALFVNIVGNDMNASVMAIQYILSAGGYNIADNYIECFGGIGVRGEPQGAEVTDAKCNIARNYFQGAGPTGGTWAISLGTISLTNQFNVTIQDNVCVSFANNDILLHAPGKTFVLRNRCMSPAPANSIYIGNVIGAPVVVEDNWFQKGMQIDAPADVASGILILRRNAVNNVFTPTELRGNWTATDQSGAGLVLAQTTQAVYRRQDKLVTCALDITYPATADAAVARISLPFLIAAGPGAAIAGSVGFSTVGIAVFPSGALGVQNFIFWDVLGNPLTNAQMSDKRINVAFTYPVD